MVLDERKYAFDFKWYHWFLIAAIDIIGPFSTDSYIPNLPEMSKELDAPAELGGLTLQANWLAKGVATLAIGKLADSRRVGRKGALLGAFLFYVAGTAACSTVARDRGGAWVLVGARVVQGIGESATTVTSAIARDVLLDVDERMKMLALLGSLRPIAIIAAPSVGGLAGAAFGWRYVFRGLAAWGALLFLGTAALLPETRPPDDAPAPRSVNGGPPAKRAAGFRAVLARLGRGAASRSGADEERLAAASLVCTTLGMAGVMAFLSTISPLLELRFDVPTVYASLLIGSLPALIIATNGALAWLIGRRQRAGTAPPTPGAVIRLSLAGTAVAAAVAIACAVGPRSPLRTSWYPLYGVLLLYNLGQSVSMGPCGAAFMQPFADSAGVAAALQIIVNTAFGVGASAAVTTTVASYGVRALLLALAAAAIGMQFAWPLLPPKRDTPLRAEDGGYVSFDTVDGGDNDGADVGLPIA